MSKFYLISFLSFLSFDLFGQCLSVFDCEVIVENRSLKMPFIGGLNNPQTYSVDLNNDGLMDLVMLDRDGDVIIPLKRIDNENGVNYEYAFDFKKSFPDVRQWFVLRDFNQDGIMDLFCFPQANYFGIEIRKGKYVNDTLKFDIVRFNEIIGAPDILPIPSSNGNFTNLYVGNNDQPEIIDVDQDGDMDVLTFDAGGSYMNYWKNYALEKGLGLDTFSMELENDCWGKFYENDSSQEVLLSDDGMDCASLFEEEEIAVNRHSGSCVTAFDENGDGNLDLLLGDLSNNQILFLRNGNTSEDAWMNYQDVNFPSYDVPVFVEIFNAAFFVDVNNDEKRDLIVSPNANSNIENYKVNWFYANVGTDAEPEFQYQSNLLFVEDMIDFGSATSPTFTDYNQDGLMDIVVGCRGRYLGQGQNDARLYLFENKGTISSPIFEMVDDDFANYAQYATTALAFNPCFGDLDGDGDIDMIVGDNNGYLFYSENLAGPGNPYDFKPAVYQYMDIRPGNLVRPSIIDLNEDGLSDLVLGERNNNSDGNGKVGAVIYYPNIGELGAPMFEADENLDPNIVAFGKVNTQTPSDITALSAPYFYSQGDELLLFVGSKSGKINIYDEILGNLQDTFNLAEDNYGMLNEGSATTVAVYDIDNDNKLEMLVGNERGGLSFFDLNVAASDQVANENIVKADITIYPNPTNSRIHIKNEDRVSVVLSAYDGRKLITQDVSPNGSIDLSLFPSGVYLLKVHDGKNQYLKKVIKL